MPDGNPDGWVIRTRDDLVNLLTRVEVRVLASGPAAGMVNAESFADALLGELPRLDAGVTEWAIAYTHRPSLGLSPRRVIQPYPDEAMAREAVADIRRMEPGDEPAVMIRQVGPWTPADEPATRETGEGNG